MFRFFGRKIRNPNSTPDSSHHKISWPFEGDKTSRSLTQEEGDENIRILIKNGQDHAEIVMKRRDLVRYPGSYFTSLFHFQDEKKESVEEIEIEADLFHMTSICEFLKDGEIITSKQLVNSKAFNELVSYLKLPVFEVIPARCVTKDCPFWGTVKNHGMCSLCCSGGRERYDAQIAERQEHEKVFTSKRITDHAFNTVLSNTLLDELFSLSIKDTNAIDQHIQSFNDRMKSEGIILKNKGISSKVGNELMIKLFPDNYREEYGVSNMVARRWVVDPWNLDQNIHPTGVCYHGNLGEFPYRNQLSADTNLDLPRGQNANF